MDATAVQSLGFFPFFAILWVSISTLLSFMGGWHDLAQRFRTTAKIAGTKFSGVSGSIGRSFFPVNYNGCLRVTVGDTGIGLAVFFLFRIFHPALFIPWSAVKSVEKYKLFFIKGARIEIRGFEGRIVLAGKAGQAVLEAFAKRALGMAHSS